MEVDIVTLVSSSTTVSLSFVLTHRHLNLVPKSYNQNNWEDDHVPPLKYKNHVITWLAQ
jgi:hypothetical protein